MEQKAITVQIVINAPIAKAWECWSKPEHITGWAFASDDWEAPSAENDLRVGGTFKTRMQAKDESSGFDFTGTYTAVKEHELIEYDMIGEGPSWNKDSGEARHVRVEFEDTPGGVRITETFDPEHENPEEMQRSGWQAILDNLKKYTEAQNWIKKLEQEGFTGIRVCPVPPNQDLPEHTHDEHTVHVILNGELTIADSKGTNVFRPGDRVEFPAGTTHRARGSIDNGTMVIGVKSK